MSSAIANAAREAGAQIITNAEVLFIRKSGSYNALLGHHISQQCQNQR